MAWLNLFLLVLEFLTLSVCQYEFLSHNERAIYLKKGWYFLLFFVDYAVLFAATTLTGQTAEHRLLWEICCRFW